MVSGDLPTVDGRVDPGAQGLEIFICGGFFGGRARFTFWDLIFTLDVAGAAMFTEFLHQGENLLLVRYG
jgi:hypothetical protein